MSTKIRKILHPKHILVTIVAVIFFFPFMIFIPSMHVFSLLAYLFIIGCSYIINKAIYTVVFKLYIICFNKNKSSNQQNVKLPSDSEEFITSLTYDDYMEMGIIPYSDPYLETGYYVPKEKISQKEQQTLEVEDANILTDEEQALLESTKQKIEKKAQEALEKSRQKQLLREKSNGITEQDKTLSDNFFVEYYESLEKLNSLFHSYWFDKDYEKALEILNRIKVFCNKNRGGQVYFKLKYEMLHDQQNSCFSWEEKILERIAYDKKYEQLKIEILNTIKDMPILQSELYKSLGENKNMGVKIINELVNSKAIVKEKKGRSYLLIALEK